MKVCCIPKRIQDTPLTFSSQPVLPAHIFSTMTPLQKISISSLESLLFYFAKEEFSEKMTLASRIGWLASLEQNFPCKNALSKEKTCDSSSDKKRPRTGDVRLDRSVQSLIRQRNVSNTLEVSRNVFFFVYSCN